MAPRAPESRAAFLKRLDHAAHNGAVEVRFGSHHFTHAACLEDGIWRIRRLECSTEDAEAFMAEHGMFMPENAEDLSKPTTIVAEAATLEDLLEQLLGLPWPMR